MSEPDRRSRVEALYLAARSRDSEERSAFLDASCADDVDLRREVESLLAKSTGDSSLHPPAAAAAAAMIVPSALESVFDNSGEAMTVTSPGALRTPSAPGLGPQARMTGGQLFGPYRIVRLLGWGGMGNVYEVEHVEQGRRLALKVLSRRLADADDRARFLREGRLAASINHRHSVYIFGSDEIAGTPVIAMELLPGGTLKDRVREHGSLPPAEAVDAILQVIAGLQAAQNAGILHRDIKPANCFVDRDGTVKVGDFGLSISTIAHDATHLTKSGTFRGTPQFAAPEQLRGEQLDVRSDVYAVGATVYYLLTGQPPFDDGDLMRLLTRIATEVPRSPRALQPRVPRGLARIVARCLAKDRAARPTTYTILSESLRPFGSEAPTPATLGLRLGAGVIDTVLLSQLTRSVYPSWVMDWLLQQALRGTLQPEWIGPAMSAFTMAMAIGYYAALEGLWGASIGKWIAGLRVRQANGQPAGMARALWRAVVFEAAPSMVTSLVTGFVVRPMPGPSLWSMGSNALFLLLFSTARRSNGFAAVHELASGTRVVNRRERGIRSALDAPCVKVRAAAGARTPGYGPYEILETLGPTDVGELLLGFDPSLRRQVWIHRLPLGTAAVAPLIRDHGRSGRLRWLNGRRSQNEAWDAYESLDGASLVNVIDTPQPWRRVRAWLLDLAREIDAGLQDGSITALTIDRVWITRDGYAKLLDFRVPCVPPSTQQGAVTLESGQRFLESVGRCALAGSSDDESSTTAARGCGPLPLSAKAALETLGRRGFTTSSEMVARMSDLLRGPDRVERGRRAAHFGGLVPAILLLWISVLPTNLELLMTPSVRALSGALSRLSSLMKDPQEQDDKERAALGVYIAGQFRLIRLANPLTFVESPGGRGSFGEERQLLLQEVVADHPTVSDSDLAMATATLGPFFVAEERRHRLKLVLFAAQLALFALFGVWVLRGGLILRGCGMAVVTAEGKPASRTRALWRGLAGWGFVPAAIWVGVGFGSGYGISLGVLILAGAAWALVHPERGLPDRIAGTWLVPV